MLSCDGRGDQLELYQVHIEMQARLGALGSRAVDGTAVEAQTAPRGGQRGDRVGGSLCANTACPHGRQAAQRSASDASVIVSYRSAQSAAVSRSDVSQPQASGRSRHRSANRGSESGGGSCMGDALLSEEGMASCRMLLLSMPYTLFCLSWRKWGPPTGVGTLGLAAEGGDEQGVPERLRSEATLRRVLIRLKTHRQRAQPWSTSPAPHDARTKSGTSACSPSQWRPRMGW